MSHDTYTCLCCSPLVSELFMGTDLQIKVKAAVCECGDKHCPSIVGAKVGEVDW